MKGFKYFLSCLLVFSATLKKKKKKKATQLLFDGNLNSISGFPFLILVWQEACFHVAISCGFPWPWSKHSSHGNSLYYTVKASLYPTSPKCWDFGCTPPQPAFSLLLNIHRLKNITLFIFLFYYFCVCVHAYVCGGTCATVCVEIRIQCSRADSLLPLYKF